MEATIWANAAAGAIWLVSEHGGQFFVPESCSERISSKWNYLDGTTAEQRRRAGISLWEKTEAYKQRQPGLSHKEAFRLVLLENPTLAEHYTGFSFRRGGD